MMGDLHVQGSEFETPPTPALPWWFTAECESQLMSVSEPPQTAPSPVPPIIPRPPPPTAPRLQLPLNQLRVELKRQLEFYFSRDNLMTDRFLRCQMDNDQYVPIRIIAGFPKVKKLTNDFNLIVQVLRESSQLQVDDAGERVRAVSKRCTIILREIPETTDKKEVESMFVGAPSYISLEYGLNNSWYVTFPSEEATQRAYLHLQNLGKTFNNRPICRTEAMVVGMNQALACSRRRMDPMMPKPSDYKVGWMTALQVITIHQPLEDVEECTHAVRRLREL
ncbi:hypothetical protein AB6A40_004980 [Gnathostoma spinigerum]|uniref:HTH La-type RNA-binding domain-containing protein n=1 Tax=Gnathostoma spinigerum TaxID=75299 RepID=A0ABD6EGE7_9BILA